jgi:hypothetical protein
MNYFSSILFVFWANLVLAQAHLVPLNGADGVSGGISRSFRIGWERIDNALGYEYILSDNPACFEGCPGDTRQANTLDTTAVEYNLQENKWYYWITRIFYDTGDTSYWSPITSFLAKNPPEKPLEDFVEIFPNPIMGENLSFQINWGINPKINSFTIQIYDYDGKVIVPLIEVQKGIEWIELYSIMVNTPHQNQGILEVKLGDNPNNPNNTIRKKIVFAQ